jgi:aldehyde dehydrogenase family protein
MALGSILPNRLMRCWTRRHDIGAGGARAMIRPQSRPPCSGRPQDELERVFGGKSPVLVSESAHLREVATEVMFAKSTNAGQICLARLARLLNTQIRR